MPFNSDNRVKLEKWRPLQDWQEKNVFSLRRRSNDYLSTHPAAEVGESILAQRHSSEWMSGSLKDSRIGQGMAQTRKGDKLTSSVAGFHTQETSSSNVHWLEKFKSTPEALLTGTSEDTLLNADDRDEERMRNNFTTQPSRASSPDHLQRPSPAMSTWNVDELEQDKSRPPPESDAGSAHSPMVTVTRHTYSESVESDLYSHCLNHLKVIDAFTELQQGIFVEMKKQVKLDSLLNRKMSNKAERLSSLMQMAEQIEAPAWIKKAFSDLHDHVSQQAQAHYVYVNALNTHCTAMQQSIDSHQELMKCVISPADSKTSVLKDNGQDREDLNEEDMSFLQASKVFEEIRKPRIRLTNKLDFFRAQMSVTMSQLAEVESKISEIRKIGEEVSTRFQLQDLKLRAEFLRNHHEQLKSDMQAALNEITNYDVLYKDKLMGVLNVFQQHRSRYDTALRNYFQLLSAVSLRDSKLTLELLKNELPFAEIKKPNQDESYQTDSKGSGDINSECSESKAEVFNIIGSQLTKAEAERNISKNKNHLKQEKSASLNSTSQSMHSEGHPKVLKKRTGIKKFDLKSAEPKADAGDAIKKVNSERLSPKKTKEIIYDVKTAAIEAHRTFVLESDKKDKKMIIEQREEVKSDRGYASPESSYRDGLIPELHSQVSQITIEKGFIAKYSRKPVSEEIRQSFMEGQQINRSNKAFSPPTVSFSSLTDYQNNSQPDYQCKENESSVKTNEIVSSVSRDSVTSYDPNYRTYFLRDPLALNDSPRTQTVPKRPFLIRSQYGLPTNNQPLVDDDKNLQELRVSELINKYATPRMNTLGTNYNNCETIGSLWAGLAESKDHEDKLEFENTENDSMSHLAAAIDQPERNVKVCAVRPISTDLEASVKNEEEKEAEQDLSDDTSVQRFEHLKDFEITAGLFMVPKGYVYQMRGQNGEHSQAIHPSQSRALHEDARARSFCTNQHNASGAMYMRDDSAHVYSALDHSSTSDRQVLDLIVERNVAKNAQLAYQSSSDESSDEETIPKSLYSSGQMSRNTYDSIYHHFIDRVKGSDKDSRPLKSNLKKYSLSSTEISASSSSDITQMCGANSSTNFLSCDRLDANSHTSFFIPNSVIGVSSATDAARLGRVAKKVRFDRIVSFNDNTQIDTQLAQLERDTDKRMVSDKSDKNCNNGNSEDHTANGVKDSKKKFYKKWGKRKYVNSTFDNVDFNKNVFYFTLNHNNQRWTNANDSHRSLIQKRVLFYSAFRYHFAGRNRVSNRKARIDQSVNSRIFLSRHCCPLGCDTTVNDHASSNVKASGRDCKQKEWRNDSLESKAIRKSIKAKWACIRAWLHPPWHRKAFVRGACVHERYPSAVDESDTAVCGNEKFSSLSPIINNVYYIAHISGSCEAICNHNQVNVQGSADATTCVWTQFCPYVFATQSSYLYKDDERSEIKTCYAYKAYEDISNVTHQSSHKHQQRKYRNNRRPRHCLSVLNFMFGKRKINRRHEVASGGRCTEDLVFGRDCAMTSKKMESDEETCSTMACCMNLAFVEDNDAEMGSMDSEWQASDTECKDGEDVCVKSKSRVPKRLFCLTRLNDLNVNNNTILHRTAKSTHKKTKVNGKSLVSQPINCHSSSDLSARKPNNGTEKNARSNKKSCTAHTKSSKKNNYSLVTVVQAEPIICSRAVSKIRNSRKMKKQSLKKLSFRSPVYSRFVCSNSDHEVTTMECNRRMIKGTEKEAKSYLSKLHWVDVRRLENEQKIKRMNSSTALLSLQKNNRWKLNKSESLSSQSDSTQNNSSATYNTKRGEGCRRPSANAQHKAESSHYVGRTCFLVRNKYPDACSRNRNVRPSARRQCARCNSKRNILAMGYPAVQKSPLDRNLNSTKINRKPALMTAANRKPSRSAKKQTLHARKRASKLYVNLGKSRSKVVEQILRRVNSATNYDKSPSYLDNMSLPEACDRKPSKCSAVAKSKIVVSSRYLLKSSRHKMSLETFNKELPKANSVDNAGLVASSAHYETSTNNDNTINSEKSETETSSNFNEVNMVDSHGFDPFISSQLDGSLLLVSKRSTLFPRPVEPKRKAIFYYQKFVNKVKNEYSLFDDRNYRCLSGKSQNISCPNLKADQDALIYRQPQWLLDENGPLENKETFTTGTSQPKCFEKSDIKLPDKRNLENMAMSVKLTPRLTSEKIYEAKMYKHHNVFRATYPIKRTLNASTNIVQKKPTLTRVSTDHIVTSSRPGLSKLMTSNIPFRRMLHAKPLPSLLIESGDETFNDSALQMACKYHDASLDLSDMICGHIAAPNLSYSTALRNYGPTNTPITSPRSACSLNDVSFLRSHSPAEKNVGMMLNVEEQTSAISFTTATCWSKDREQKKEANLVSNEMSCVKCITEKQVGTPLLRGNLSALSNDSENNNSNISFKDPEKTCSNAALNSPQKQDNRDALSCGLRRLYGEGVTGDTSVELTAVLSRCSVVSNNNSRASKTQQKSIITRGSFPKPRDVPVLRKSHSHTQIRALSGEERHIRHVLSDCKISRLNARAETTPVIFNGDRPSACVSERAHKSSETPLNSDHTACNDSTTLTADEISSEYRFLVDNVSFDIAATCSDDSGLSKTMRPKCHSSTSSPKESSSHIEGLQCSLSTTYLSTSVSICAGTSSLSSYSESNRENVRRMFGKRHCFRKSEAAARDLDTTGCNEDSQLSRTNVPCNYSPTRIIGESQMDAYYRSFPFVCKQRFNIRKHLEASGYRMKPKTNPSKAQRLQAKNLKIKTVGNSEFKAIDASFQESHLMDNKPSALKNSVDESFLGKSQSSFVNPKTLVGRSYSRPSSEWLTMRHEAIPKFSSFLEGRNGRNSTNRLSEALSVCMGANRNIAVIKSTEANLRAKQAVKLDANPLGRFVKDNCKPHHTTQHFNKKIESHEAEVDYLSSLNASFHTHSNALAPEKKTDYCELVAHKDTSINKFTGIDTRRPNEKLFDPIRSFRSPPVTGCLKGSRRNPGKSNLTKLPLGKKLQVSFSEKVDSYLDKYMVDMNDKLHSDSEINLCCQNGLLSKPALRKTASKNEIVKSALRSRKTSKIYATAPETSTKNPAVHWTKIVRYSQGVPITYEIYYQKVPTPNSALVTANSPDTSSNADKKPSTLNIYGLQKPCNYRVSGVK